MIVYTDSKPRQTIQDARIKLLTGSTTYIHRKELSQMVYVPPPEIVRVGLEQNELFVGCNSVVLNKDNVVKLNIGLFGDYEKDRTSLVITFLGIKGTGKSIMSSIVFFDNFRRRYGNYLFVVDPQNEFWVKKKPYPDGGVDSFFDELNMKRQGYNMLIVSPRFLRKNQNIDRYFSISYKNIVQLRGYDPILAARLFIELLGINDTNETHLDLISGTMQDVGIESFAQFRRMLYKNQKKFGGVADTIAKKIDSKLRLGVISDNTTYWLDILSELKLYDAVVFRGMLKGSSMDNYYDLPYSATLKILLALIMYDNIGYFVEKEQDAVLKNDVSILIDEADTVAPESGRSTTKEFVRMLATKGRKAKINLGLIVQESSLLDHELFAQTNIIFSSQITEENAKVLIRRGVNPEHVDFLRHLKRKVVTTIGTGPSEWCAITEDKKITLFVPLPPQADFIRG